MFQHPNHGYPDCSLDSNTSVAPTVSGQLEIAEDPASADGK